MADMEETGQTITGFEEDPAAAFLAREQDELADIAGETLGVGVGDSEARQRAGRERSVTCHNFSPPPRRPGRHL